MSWTYSLPFCLVLAGCTSVPVSQAAVRMPDTVRVRVFPSFVQPGSEVIVQTRPLAGAVCTCLRIIDGDGMAWAESCGADGPRRVPFRPSHPGKHIAYLAYQRPDGTWTTSAKDKAEFCVLGGDTGDICP